MEKVRLIEPYKRMNNQLKHTIVKALKEKIKELWFITNYDICYAKHTDSIYLELVCITRHTANIYVSIRNHNPKQNINGYIYIFVSDYTSIEELVNYTSAYICVTYNSNQRNVKLRCEPSTLSKVDTSELNSNLAIYHKYNKFEDMLNNYRHESIAKNKYLQRFKKW